MAVYSTGLVELPDLDKVLEDIGRALGPWTYLLVGVLAFAEAAAFLGLVVPGETAIIVAGVVAGQGEIDIVALIALVWTCSVLGDLTGLMLGRRLGRPFLLRHGPRVGVSEERVHQVDRFFERHGGKAVFLARFVGLARALSPFLAGSSGMSLRRFLPYDVLGAGIQSTVLCLIGYVFWHSLDRVLAIAKQGALALGTTIAVVVGLVVAVRWVRVPENRRRIDAWLEAHENNPAVRLLLAAGRRARRPARFLWARLTPGGLGLELTTLLAIGAVGGYVFFGLHARARQRRADAGRLGARRPGSDALRDRRARRPRDRRRAPGVAARRGRRRRARRRRPARAARAAGGGGARRRARPDRRCAAALADGALVRAAPRPTAGHGRRTRTQRPRTRWPGSPSRSRCARGRAAGGEGGARRASGSALTAAVALAAVYLGEDWFSDAAGGVGLGVLCWSLAGIAGLLTRAR